MYLIQLFKIHFFLNLLPFIFVFCKVPITNIVQLSFSYKKNLLRVHQYQHLPKTIKKFGSNVNITPFQQPNRYHTCFLQSDKHSYTIFDTFTQKKHQKTCFSGFCHSFEKMQKKSSKMLNKSRRICFLFFTHPEMDSTDKIPYATYNIFLKFCLNKFFLKWTILLLLFFFSLI